MHQRQLCLTLFNARGAPPPLARRPYSLLGGPTPLASLAHTRSREPRALRSSVDSRARLELPRILAPAKKPRHESPRYPPVRRRSGMNRIRNVCFSAAVVALLVAVAFVTVFEK